MNQYPLIDNRELLDPIVIIIPKGKKNPTPLDAIIYTQREYEYLQRLSRDGVDVNVKLTNPHNDFKQLEE